MTDAPNNRPRAVFFDMDGVLYDSMPTHEYSWTRTFEAEGIRFEPEDAYMNEGRTGRGTINLVFNRVLHRNATDAEMERIYSRKTELVKQCAQPPLMPRMAELIDWLRTLDVKTLVVTGSKQPSLLDKLARDFGFCPADIVSGADVKKGKPDPEPYLIALERSGCRRTECAVVENAPLGIRSAKAAGLFTIAVNTGKLSDKDLTCEGCDRLFPSTAALVEAWKQGDLSL